MKMVIERMCIANSWMHFRPFDPLEQGILPQHIISVAMDEGKIHVFYWKAIPIKNSENEG